jgi:hypothetical protein
LLGLPADNLHPRQHYILCTKALRPWLLSESTSPTEWFAPVFLRLLVLYKVTAPLPVNGMMFLNRRYTADLTLSLSMSESLPCPFLCSFEFLLKYRRCAGLDTGIWLSGSGRVLDSRQVTCLNCMRHSNTLLACLLLILLFGLLFYVFCFRSGFLLFPSCPD